MIFTVQCASQVKQLSPETLAEKESPISIIGVNQIEVGGLHLFTENHPRSCSVLLQILKSPPAAFLMESWWWVLLLLGFGGVFRILDVDEDCFSSILDPPPPQITTSRISHGKLEVGVAPSWIWRWVQDLGLG